MEHVTPIHPGRVLQDELEELGVTQSELARHIKVRPKTINEICRGKRGISAEMATKLSLALGASSLFWLNLQKNWELKPGRSVESAKHRTDCSVRFRQRGPERFLAAYGGGIRESALILPVLDELRFGLAHHLIG